ncbi:hypothetical protein ACLB1R_16720 [Escherichia coli]
MCGITVYDRHIGHGRTFVAFDVVARYLRFLGYKLKYVRHITRYRRQNHQTRQCKWRKLCGAGEIA